MDKQKNDRTSGGAVMRLYTMKQVAALWGLSYWTVRGMVLDGTIKPYVGIGRGYKFDGMELGAAKLERL